MADGFNFGLMNLFGGDTAGLNELLTPEQLAAMQRQGALSMAAQLLAASGPSRTPVNLGQALGQAYMAGQQGYSQAQQQALTGMLTKQKIDEYKRQRAADAAWRQTLSSAMSPQTAAQRQPNMPPIPGTMTQQPVAQTGVAGRAQMLTPIQLALLGGMPAKEGQAKMFDIVSRQDPEIIRTMDALGLSRTPENYAMMKKSGATTVNVGTGKGAIGVLEKAAGEDLAAAKRRFMGANQTLRNIDLMAPVVSDSITGALAEERTFMLRVGSLLGLTGADEEERLAKTRQLVQGLARQELEAAASMRGQGQITENERKILRKMSAGTQDMTPAELRVGMAALQKLALQQQQEYFELLAPFKKMEDFKAISGSYNLTPYTPRLDLSGQLVQPAAGQGPGTEGAENPAAKYFR